MPYNYDVTCNRCEFRQIPVCDNPSNRALRVQFLKAFINWTLHRTLPGRRRRQDAESLRDAVLRMNAAYCADGICGYYVCHDGTEVPIPAQTAWCQHCGKVVSAERCPDVDEIDRWIADAPQYRHELECIRRWRLLRKSPPRCLICGDTAVTRYSDEIVFMPPYPFPTSDYSIASLAFPDHMLAVHPGCQGTLLFRCVGHASRFRDRSHKNCYSPEGVLVLRAGQDRADSQGTPGTRKPG